RVGATGSKGAKPMVFSSSGARESESAPGGPGAIRKVGGGRVFVQEETVEYEQDRRHTYKLVGPAPVDDYLAEVVFTPNAAGGTDIRWTGSFVEKLRGTG